MPQPMTMPAPGYRVNARISAARRASPSRKRPASSRQIPHRQPRSPDEPDVVRGGTKDAVQRPPLAARFGGPGCAVVAEDPTLQISVESSRSNRLAEFVRNREIRRPSDGRAQFGPVEYHASD